MRKGTQEYQVVETLRKSGGVATLRRLNEIVDVSSWNTKTPEATIRRIVQTSDAIFRIQPGLWALEEMRQEVLRKFQLKIGDQQSEERFSHSYYQGLLVEIGKLSQHTTFIPAQDKNRLFLDKKLSEVSDLTTLPRFSYDHILRSAKTVDVIWFNERNMPSEFYEVEHTTDIKNSLSKFYELQDFHSRFFIVANENRQHEFEDKLHLSIFSPIASRVQFLSYEQVAGMHMNLNKLKNVAW